MLLLLLAACGCPDFEQTEIVDRTGELSDEQLDGYRAHMDWFAEVTGLSGVCVGEVRIVEDIEGAHARYSAWRDRIELDVDADASSFTHELCHAADVFLGEPSLDHPDLFDPDSVEEVESYPTERLRTREAFARACEDAVEDIRIERAIADECGEPMDLAARDFVRAEIWRYLEDPPLDLAFEDVETGPDWRLSDVLGDVHGLLIAGTDTTVAVLTAGWPVGLARDDPGLGNLRLHVVHIDPWTQKIVSATHLRQHKLDQVALLHDTDAVWVLSNRSDGGTQAFRVPLGGGLERHAFPDVTHRGPGGGVVLGDSAWLFDAFPNGGDMNFATTVVDLPTAVASSTHPFLPPDPRGSWQRPIPSPDAPHLAVTTTDGEPLLVSLLDGERTAAPWTWGVPMAIAEDGTVIVDGKADHAATTSALARVSPDETWIRFDPTMCDQPTPRERYAVQVGQGSWLVDAESKRATDIMFRQLPL